MCLSQENASEERNCEDTCHRLQKAYQHAPYLKCFCYMAWNTILYQEQYMFSAAVYS